MTDTQQTGKTGEQLACKYLEELGYQILETNWQSQHLEVDIIARKNDILVIAEVKTRRSKFFGEPEEFVNRNKQRLLIRAANSYLISSSLDLEVRFDIISVIIMGQEYKINHIPDAFYPTL